MSTSGDSVLPGKLESLLHRRGVTGVAPAGDVGRSDVTHEFSIAAVSQALIGLAHIGIEVNGE